MPRVLWCDAKCGELQRKQIPCSGKCFGSFLLLPLKSSLLLGCRIALPYLEGSRQACCRNLSAAENSCSWSTVFPCRLYVQPWVVTLHWCTDASFPLPLFQTLQHSDGEGGFSSVWRALLCLCLDWDIPPPSSPYSITHIVYVKDKHVCHTVSPALPRFSQLIDKFWFSRAGWSSHPSSPFWRMSCLKNKTNKFSTKGWRGRLQFLMLLTDTDRFGTHKKDPFLNHLICCIFHGSRSTCSISGHLISCHPLYIHYWYLAS